MNYEYTIAIVFYQSIYYTVTYDTNDDMDGSLDCFFFVHPTTPIVIPNEMQFIYPSLTKQDVIPKNSSLDVI